MTLFFVFHDQDSSSVVEESPSSDQTDRRTPAACLSTPKKQQHRYLKSPVLMSSSHSPNKRRRRVKEQVSQQHRCRDINAQMVRRVFLKLRVKSVLNCIGSAWVARYLMAVAHFMSWSISHLHSLNIIFCYSHTSEQAETRSTFRQVVDLCLDQFW